MSSAPASKTELIESKIDKAIANGLTVGDSGMSFSDMGQVMEFSKVMAVSGQAVPAHCRNNVGTCLAVIVQALEWRMSPFAVANKSYVVNDRVAYESQLIHAVIEQRAPITCRLRHSFSGTGDSRRCKVWATARGEDVPLEYESPEISKISPKNSPLWKTKPDLQLFYNTSRDWARVYFPDVIMGIYSRDEMLDSVIEHKRPVTLDDLAARIEGKTVIEQLPEAKGLPERLADCTTVEQVDALEQELAATWDKSDLEGLAFECYERRKVLV